LRTGGVGGAGTVQQTALEQSNVDLGTEFVRVIQAQAAYSFGIKVLRAGDELAEELLDIKS
jgi:flagellar hook protein FlgE